MIRVSLFAGWALLALAAAGSAEEKAAPGPAGLAQLKKLAGTWVRADENGNPTDQIVSVFKVTAAGSAVQETIFPGTNHEMVTLYHLDGKELVLTHYCAAGNQPRMKLDPKSPRGRLDFTFTGGSNFDPAKDTHMHEGSITVVDDDHLEWRWVAYKDGKAQDDHKVALKLVRKK